MNFNSSVANKVCVERKKSDVSDTKKQEMFEYSKQNSHDASCSKEGESEEKTEKTAKKWSIVRHKKSGTQDSVSRSRQNYYQCNTKDEAILKDGRFIACGREEESIWVACHMSRNIVPVPPRHAIVFFS